MHQRPAHTLMKSYLDVPVRFFGRVGAGTPAPGALLASMAPGRATAAAALSLLHQSSRKHATGIGLWAFCCLRGI